MYFSVVYLFHPLLKKIGVDVQRYFDIFFILISELAYMSVCGSFEAANLISLDTDHKTSAPVSRTIL